MPAPRRATLKRTVTIVNERGLHARAAAKFVQCAGRHDAAIFVVKDGQKVSGLSIMGLMMLAASQGTTLTVTAQGPAARAALDALCRLVASRFGEGA